MQTGAVAALSNAVLAGCGSCERSQGAPRVPQHRNTASMSTSNAKDSATFSVPVVLVEEDSGTMQSLKLYFK